MTDCDGSEIIVHTWIRARLHISQIRDAVAQLPAAEYQRVQERFESAAIGQQAIQSSGLTAYHTFVFRSQLQERSAGLSSRYHARLGWREQTIRLLSRNLCLASTAEPSSNKRLTAYCVVDWNPEEWLTSIGTTVGLTTIAVDVDTPLPPSLPEGHLTPIPEILGGDYILAFDASGMCIAAGRVAPDRDRWSLLATADREVVDSEHLTTLIVFATS